MHPESNGVSIHEIRDETARQASRPRLVSESRLARRPSKADLYGAKHSNLEFQNDESLVTRLSSREHGAER